MGYNAFISYSHTADVAIAAALQSSLHSFARPWYKLRALHIFRDQTNLAVNPALWSSIREALDQSMFYILLASPEAAVSPWVEMEAAYWIAKNGPSRVLIVVTGGTLKWDRASGCFTSELTNSLPPGLLRSFPEEPLFIDLRWARDSNAPPLRLREPRFHEAVLQLAATLHNRPKDELDGADIRIRRETRLIAASGLAAILVTALFAARQMRLVHDKSLQKQAADLASHSATVLADSPDRVAEAALLAIESVRLAPSFEATQALRAAVSLLPANAQSYAPQDSDPTERIRDLAFSPGGSTLAVGRDNGSTQLIDVVHHKEVGYFAPDEQPVAHLEFGGDPAADLSDNNAAVSVAFNTSNSQLASGARDGLVHVWALPGGRELLRVSHSAPVSQVAFHPKANQLATACDDGHVRVFDVARAALVADFQAAGKMVGVAFSPGGELVATLSSDGDVSVFDLAHRKLLRKLAGGEAAFNLAFSADGKRLAAADGDYAFVWDATTGQQLLKATHAPSSDTLGPQQWIYSAAISADGKLLAYASRGDGLARVWNVETGRQILELKHSSAVAAVFFNSDGTKLGTGSYDGTARVWELPSGNELERASLGGGAEVVAFSPGFTRFAAGGMQGGVVVSETRRADRPASFDLPDGARSVAFSPYGRRLAIGTVSVHHSPLVRIADIDGNILRDIEVHGATTVDRLFFVDQDKLVAQWSNDLFLIAVDQGSATPLSAPSGEKRIDPSGKVLAEQNDTVSRLYELPGLRQIAEIEGPAVSTLLRPVAQGIFLAFEADKPPNEFAIEVWSVASKTRVSRVVLPAELTRLAFNSSGTVLFTAESENLQAWDIPSGKRKFSLAASADVDVIVPAPSSDSVATLAHGHLMIWDAATGARLAQLPDVGYVRAAAFSPDGRYLLTGYDERAAAVWLWRTSDLREQACARLPGNLSRSEWAHWFPKQSYRQTCPNLPAPQ